MNTKPDTPPQGTGIEGAASAIETLMTTEEPVIPDTPKVVETADETPAEDGEALSNGPVDETLDEDEALLSDDSEDEPLPGEDEAEATETEEDLEEDTPQTELHTVKINGKEEQVSLDEALQGYQRQSDYTRKSQALAEERKSLEKATEGHSSEVEAVKAERAQYAELLVALSQQVRGELDREPDWDALYQANPAEFTRQRAIFDDNRRRYDAAQSELTRVQQQHAEESQADMQKLVTAEKAKLMAAVPEWKNPKVFEADKKAIREFGTSIGFSAEELSSTFDHRAVLALRMAARYSAMLAKRPKAKAGTGPKTARPGSAAQQPGGKTKTSNAIKRLEKSGSRDDAAAAMLTLL